MLLWLQDCEAHVLGALEMLAGLVTNVLAFFPLLLLLSWNTQET